MASSLRAIRKALPRLDGGTLFYPCSGNDYRWPVRLFAPFIRTFWFVDVAYFRSGCCDFQLGALGGKPERVWPMLDNEEELHSVDSRVEGPEESRSDRHDIEPCILTETYRHVRSGREIEVKFRRGYGRSAFRRDLGAISVFFYRRDSLGEGGSGNLWMTRDSFDEICSRLVDGGIVVTDGGNAGWHKGTYPQLSQFHGRDTVRTDDIAERAGSFETRDGHIVRCLGCVGRGYGPALAWQVTRNPAIACPAHLVYRLPEYASDLDRGGEAEDLVPRTGRGLVLFPVGPYEHASAAEGAMHVQFRT